MSVNRMDEYSSTSCTLLCVLYFVYLCTLLCVLVYFTLCTCTLRTPPVAPQRQTPAEEHLRHDTQVSCGSDFERTRLDLERLTGPEARPGLGPKPPGGGGSRHAADSGPRVQRNRTHLVPLLREVVYPVDPDPGRGGPGAPEPRPMEPERPMGWLGAGASFLRSRCSTLWTRCWVLCARPASLPV